MIKSAVKPLLFVSILFALTSNISFGQNTFRISYDIDNFDLPGGVVETPSGNYLAAGTNASFIPLYGDLTEIDQTGNVVWAKSYIASIATEFADVRNVSTGGYIVGGASDPGLMLMRVDNAGNFTWGNKYETNNGVGEGSSRVKETSDGGFIVAGNVTGYDIDGGGPAVPLDSNNIFIIKTNAAGALSWHNIIIVTTLFDNDHTLSDVTEVSDGYIFVGSTSEDQATDNVDALIMKTDLSGNLQWIRKFGDAGSSEGLTSATTLASGEVLIGGYYGSQMLMLRVNSAGTATWGYRYTDGTLFTAEVAQSFDVFPTSDGKYASIGMYLDPSTIPTTIGAYLIKVEPSNGSIIFQKFYNGGLSSLIPEGFQVSSDNGYMVLMMSQQMTGFNYHAIKTDEFGELLDPGCTAGDITLGNSGYTPSWTTITPGTYTGASSSGFTPVVSNVTPVRTVDCITCALPDPTVAASPSSICGGDPATITASGSGGAGITYEVYTVPSGGTSIGNAPLVVTPATTTTYYIEATDGSCTSNRISVTITVNTQPSISVSPTSATICTGDNVSLTASSSGSGPSYSWTPATGLSATTGATVTASPTSTQTYDVTVTDVNSCTNTTSVTVTVTPPPTAVITGPTTACDNAPITLTATPGGASYLWSTGATTETITVNPATSTTYSVTVTVGSCNDSDSHTVTVNTAPTAGITGDNDICDGESTTLTASPASGVSYDWSTTATTSTINVSPTATTSYEVIVEDGNLCRDTAQYTVTVNALPTVVANSAPGTTVCDGDMITLTGSGASSYSWDNGATDGVAFPISSTTTYTVTGTDANNCSNTDQVTITVNALPTVVANSAPGTTVCDGDMITLTGSGASSYSWDNGATDGVAFPISSTTTYTVTGTDGNGCTNTDQVTITVNALPTVVANSAPGTTVCDGDMITLTGSGASSYSWDNGATDGVAFPISSTTTYTVTGTDGNGCSGTDQVTITVNALPTVVANSVPGTTVCDGDMITLTGSGASTYSWDNGATDGVAFPISSTTTYTVTGTDANSCSNTDQVTITVNALPTIAISGLDTICNGDNTTLTASGASSYSWDTGDNTPSITVTPATTTTYTVTGTDANSCVNTANVTVAVLPPPIASISGPVVACSNAPITLTASGGGTYSWDTGDNTSSITVNPATNTTYTVTVSIGSCTDVASQTVTVNTAPNGSVTGNNAVCLGDTTTLTASGGTIYNWNTGGTSANELVSPTAATTYEAYVEDANGCIDTVQFTVNVNPLPTINISGIDTLCLGDSTSLTAAGAISYVWNTSDITPSISVNPTATTTYSVTGTDGNGCEGVAQIEVVILPPPTASITGDSSSCEGQPITLTASGGMSYTWNTGANSATISANPTTTTTYSVIAFVGTCSDTVQYTVNVIPAPNASAGSDTTIIIGQSVVLQASGGSSYVWDADPTLDCTVCSDPEASPDVSTTYCVTVTDNGCVDTACVRVTVDIQCGETFIPTAFSPNGDSNNDCLRVYSNCLKSLVFRVYTRWGEVVFETTDINGCWDGTFNGEPLNSATFAYIAEYVLLDGTSGKASGNVSLIK